jgi:hypothetical protein
VGELVAVAPLAAATTAAAVASAASSSAASTKPTAAAASAPSATATPSAAILTGAGFIDGQGAAAVLLTVEGLNGGIGFSVVRHFDEPEALAAARVPVIDDLGG